MFQDVLKSLFKPRRAPLHSGPFVALDLDSRRLRVVHVEPRGSRPHFRKIATVDLPQGLDMNDAAAVGRFIGQSLRDLRLHGLKVAMDVPRSKAVLKTVNLPAVENPNELPAMVRFQVEKELPFGLDEAIVDFTLEPHLNIAGSQEAEPQAGETVLVAAVRKAVVEHYRQIAAAAEMDLEQLGLRPYADVHCLRACLAGRSHELANAMLIHLSADEAEIDILAGASLVFSRSTTMQVGHDESGKPLAATPVEGLTVEVVRTLQSIRATQQDVSIDRVWVTGDTGYEDELADGLTARLRTVCEVIHPVRMLDVPNAPTGANGYITALGLAIGHTGRGMPLDFLHPKEPVEEMDERKKKLTLYGAAAAAAIGFILLSGMLYRYSTSSHLWQLRNQYNQLEAANRPVDKLKSRVASIQGWMDDDKKWLDHWAHLSALFPGPQEAYVTTLRTATESTASSPGRPKGTSHLLVFTVKARSSEVITELNKKLREAGYDVKPGAESVSEDPLGYKYSTSMRLRLSDKAPFKVQELKAQPRPADDGSAQIIQSGRTGGGPS